MRIDSHQHFWKYDPIDYDWINDEMAVIRKDFFPGDLEPLLKQNGFDGCVAVQAHQSEQETEQLLNYADQYKFVKGVVGWVDLQADNIEARLAHYQQFEKLKGLRHVLQGEPQRDLMLQPRFKKGISLLSKFGFTYDILIFPDQLRFAKELVKEFSQQAFVIDHIAKPYIKDKKTDEWEVDMQAIAQHDNVYCKISGMVTEADWQTWKIDDFKPYLDIVVNSFGTSRVLFGSDWPVCLVAGSYEKVLEIVKNYFNPFSAQEQDLVFGENAVKFYNLK